jgi:hypothetical protein
LLWSDNTYLTEQVEKLNILFRECYFYHCPRHFLSRILGWA